MNLLIFVLLILIILFHIYAFVLEAILWKKPSTMKTFGTTAQTAASSYTLAINQGVYNLFLAAGLIGSLVVAEPTAFLAKLFFLSCILVAAITAGVVVSKRIMLIQGTPALVALILVIATH